MTHWWRIWNEEVQIEYTSLYTKEPNKAPEWPIETTSINQAVELTRNNNGGVLTLKNRDLAKNLKLIGPENVWILSTIVNC